MNDRETLICNLCLMVCCTIAFVAMCSCIKRNVELSWQFDHDMIRAGYVQVQNIGAAGIHWEKKAEGKQ